MPPYIISEIARQIQLNFDPGVFQIRRFARCCSCEVGLVACAMILSSYVPTLSMGPYIARRRKISSVEPKKFVGCMRIAAPVGQASTHAWSLYPAHRSHLIAIFLRISSNGSPG